MRRLTLATAAFAAVVAVAAAPPPAMIEWPYYGGDQAGTKWSAAAEINRDTVTRLEFAWSWTPGDKPLPQFGTQPGSFENTPLMIDNVLYVSTPYNRVVALDGETGREIWAHDPRAYEGGQPPNGTGFVHRGVAAWRDRGALQIFLNSRSRLFCIDARTGALVPSFGANGSISLTEGLRW
ncbi:MAG TPA: PQQ-binding-like beta-propeller repeat protein, partial [Vicinamibacterales bacterium]|nr:PQQ-binding-like beta-propeller repeat protein [Vicinamibacterales bacterium]